MPSFSGASGTMEFESNGDREVGLPYAFLNHDGDSFVTVGVWKKETGLVADVTKIVWPTASGGKPAGLNTDVIDAGGKSGVKVSPAKRVTPSR